MRFTNADFARVASKLSARLASKTADLAYGMWNPAFCDADARAEANGFLASLEMEAQHWRQRIAQAGEAGTAETTKIGSVHEHAVAESDAPKGESS